MQINSDTITQGILERSQISHYMMFRYSIRSELTSIMNGGCFGVDAQWTDDNQLLNDPKIFDCSKDVLGNPKPSHPGPVPDIRRAP
jgi:hypothetical protein